MHFSKKQLTLRTLAISALSFGIGLTMQFAGWTSPLENLYYDNWHLLAGKRAESQYAALAVVDDETLAMLKDDPLAFWQPHFATAMDTLSKAGVKAIGLDFIYQVSAEAWLRKLNLPDTDISRNYDAPFRAQLAAGNKILITHLIEIPSGDLEFMLPPQDHMLLLPAGLNDMGVANLYPDNDKIVRRFYPVILPNLDYPGIGFSTQLALRAGGLDATAQEWDVAGTHYTRNRKWHQIGYIGPPGSIPSVSMSKLLKPDALSDPQVQALRGRAVIIAANNSGTSDYHFSPYSRQLLGNGGEPMIGGEIHANIIETVLSGRFPKPLLSALQHAIALVLVVAATIAFLVFHPGRGILVGILIIIASLISSYLLFLNYLLLETAYAHASILVAFLGSLGLRLTGEERKRNKMKAMFSQYVSDFVVDRMADEDALPTMGGATVQVSVLFSDIRNFTTISEKLDAQEVVEFLNAYFELACEPILAQGGMVNKFIGDAVMAVFGSPAIYPDHARRALLASLEMVKVADEFKLWMDQRFPDRGLPPFAIGIGIHSGPAVLGDIGSSKRREFTAIGDTVNIASRLEGLTKDFGCALVASQDTVNHAGEGFEIGQRKSMAVKGKAEPVEVLEIKGLKPQ